MRNRQRMRQWPAYRSTPAAGHDALHVALFIAPSDLICLYY